MLIMQNTNDCVQCDATGYDAFSPCQYADNKPDATSQNIIAQYLTIMRIIYEKIRQKEPFDKKTTAYIHLLYSGILIHYLWYLIMTHTKEHYN